ncbi:MAG TPA: hypothetical protein VEP49_08380 [Acidimicrobiia bacterium]|nr:hypothetical protein [Acidimicrobiia bacterium]
MSTPVVPGKLCGVLTPAVLHGPPHRHGSRVCAGDCTRIAIG